jgi:hypothetical protein
MGEVVGGGVTLWNCTGEGVGGVRVYSFIIPHIDLCCS